MNLDEVQTVGVLGDRNTAKTNLMFYLAKTYKGKKQVVFYAYPKQIPYKQIHSLNELEMLTDSVIFMDEMQKHIKFYDRATSNDFLEILSTIAHNNNTLVFATPMSQYITKALDCFMTGFIYTRINDLDQLKNGSKAKRLLKEFSTERRGTRTLRLANGEYLQVVDSQEATNGLHTFKDQHIGKDWKAKRQENANKKAGISLNISQKKLLVEANNSLDISQNNLVVFPNNSPNITQEVLKND